MIPKLVCLILGHRRQEWRPQDIIHEDAFRIYFKSILIKFDRCPRCGAGLSPSPKVKEVKAKFDLEAVDKKLDEMGILLPKVEEWADWEEEFEARFGHIDIMNDRIWYDKENTGVTIKDCIKKWLSTAQAEAKREERERNKEQIKSVFNSDKRMEAVEFEGMLWIGYSDVKQMVKELVSSLDSLTPKASSKEEG